ncbi:uncharacterized protein LOC134231910 isoform X1 [Saccostrea cucullata]|uniref:uncharacterized protein LOC134231910 isoform X1 n=1 Tax=Saccostrea cuccullata TaxID=36930 RepID=UPI002ED33EAB
MHEKRPSAVRVLVSLSLPFCLWLWAIVAPGCFIIKWESTKALPVSVHKYNPLVPSLMNSKSDPLNTTTKYSLEMGIFYVTVCESGACVQEDYEKLPLKLRNSIPDLTEIKIEGISALGLCVTGFFFLLLNFGNSSRVLTGGISVLLAAVVEFVMANRMVRKVEDAIDLIWDYDRISTDGYSPIISAVGTSFSLIVLYRCWDLYSKIRRQQTTDGRKLKLCTIFNPNKFTIL